MIGSLASQADLEQAVRQRSEQNADVRLRIHAFVRDELDAICRRSSGETPQTAPVDRPLWMYWAQSEAEMPPIVAACVKQARSGASERLVLLDDERLATLVDLPAAVYAKTFANKTHFSDILRVALLSRYGGIWMDATCLATIAPQEVVEPRLGNGFLAFSRHAHDEFMLSSWFMAAAPGAIIPTLLRNALFVYWDHRDELEHYFLVHYLFEALYYAHDGFRQQWDGRSLLDAYEAHRLQGRLHEPYTAAEWSQLVTASPIHKLTYKLDSRDRSGTFYEHVVNL
jgi:hypothetical protein